MKKLLIIIFFAIISLSVLGQNPLRQYAMADSLLKAGQANRASKILSGLCQKENNDFLKKKAIDAAIKSGNAHNALPLADHISGNEKYLYLARIYAAEGLTDSAFAALKKYLTTKDKLPQYRIINDSILKKLSDYPQWKQLWQKNWYDSVSIELDRLEIQAKYGDYINAMQQLSELKKKYPDNPRIYQLLAKCYERMGNNNAAIQTLQKAYGLSNDKAEILIQISQLQKKNREFDAAARTLEQAYKINPYNIDLLPQIAGLYDRSQNYDRAVMWLNKYLSYTYSMDAEYLLANTYYHKKDYLSAIRHVNNLLKRDPNNYKYMTLRGKAYFRTNNFDRAYYDLTMSLDINPIQPQLYYLIGQSAYFIGHKQEACLYWQRSYEMFHDPLAKQQLDKICKK